MRVLVALLALASAASAAENGCILLTDHGAVCDNVANDTAAWHSAVAAARDHGGRCIQYPAGTCVIYDGIYWNAVGHQMIVKGVGSASRIRFSNPAGAWLVVGNYTEARIQDLVFVGTPGQTTDARHILLAQSGRRVVVESVTVLGVSVGPTGGHAIVKSAADVTEIVRSTFAGCAGGGGAAAVRVDSSLLVDRSRFVDVDAIDTPTEISKGTMGHWIHLASTTPHDTYGQSGAVSIEIRRSRFDEGAWKGIYLAPLAGGLRYQRVLVADSVFLAPVTTGSRAISIATAENVEIERVQVHARAACSSIDLLDAGDVDVRHSRISPIVTGAGGIHVDAATRSARSRKTNTPLWDCHAATCTVE